MLEYAMAMHDVDPSRALMAGDQIFKDVFSANRAGVRSLLVPRRGKGDHPGVRLQRIPEAAIRVAMGIPLSGKTFHGDMTGVQPLPRYAI